MLDAVDRLASLCLAPMAFGHEASNGVAVAGDEDSLTALHVIKEAGEVSFGFGRLNLTHNNTTKFLIHFISSRLVQSSPSGYYKIW